MLCGAAADHPIRARKFHIKITLSEHAAQATEGKLVSRQLMRLIEGPWFTTHIYDCTAYTLLSERLTAYCMWRQVGILA